MPVLRSREGASKISIKTLESHPTPPFEPPTPAKSDAAPTPASSFTPSPSPRPDWGLGLGLGLGSDPSGPAAPPRRRSLRLAAISSPPPADAMERTRNRKRVARVSPDEGFRGKEVTCERNGTRVLEAVGASLQDGRKRESLGLTGGDEVEGRSYMSLRSGSRIAQRSKGPAVDSDPVLKDGSPVVREVEKGMSISCVDRKEKVGEMIVLDVSGERLGLCKAVEGRGGMSAERFYPEEKEKGKLVVQEDLILIGLADIGLDADPVDEAEEHLRGDGSVQRRKPGRPKGRKQPQREVDRTRATELAPNFAFFKPEEDCRGEEVDPAEFVSDANRDLEEIEEGYMSLRSGSRISQRRIEVNGVEKKGVRMVSEGDRHSCEDKGKRKLVTDPAFYQKSSEEMVLELAGEGIRDREVKEESMAGKIGKRKFSIEEKGKSKLVVEEGFLSSGKTQVNLDAHPMVAKSEEPLQNEDELVKRSKPVVINGQKQSRKEADRSKAKELAPKFAFFKPEEDGSDEGKDDDDPEDLMPDADPEDWPGPFSTAMKIIEERDERLRARELNSSSRKDESTETRIHWTPSKDKRFIALNQHIPSLKDLCMKILMENAEEIESLGGVPDVLKHRFMSMLCRSRKMNSRILGLFMSDSPTEIHLSDCSWAKEGEFETIFAGYNTNNLKVLQLDLCGRCMPDYVLRATLARSPNSLPSLTKISLKGAYRLSDDGLNAIVSSAPSLCSINLSHCSLLTSGGIINMADKLDAVLKELYVDDCPNVDAMLILSALKKLQSLEVLSLANIQSVCDKFVRQLIPLCGSNLRELVVAGCQKLTSASIKIIGESCSRLLALDLRNLSRLNDSAIKHLADGCRSIQKLKLRRNAFSDEAIAAFLEASGGSLTELSLNNIEKVAQHTAIAIARRCSSTLQILDLSFCRNVTDEALGLIVDSCSYLRILKLFGCTQVTDVFLDGHSSPLVKIIGLKGQILDQIEIPDFL